MASFGKQLPVKPGGQFFGGGSTGGSYHSSQPQFAKVELAFDRLAEALPYRVCLSIAEVRFGPRGVIDPTFSVVFKGGDIMEFTDIDKFPSDADIAEICLRCPK